MDRLISEFEVIRAIEKFVDNIFTKSMGCLINDIKAIPSAEPCEDAISRQAVDELSKELVHTTRDKADFLCNFWEGLQKLPPVKPQEPNNYGDCGTCLNKCTDKCNNCIVTEYQGKRVSLPTNYKKK